MVKVKKCCKCKKEKECYEFNKLSSSSDGLSYHCRECASIIRKDFYHRNKIKCLDISRKWKRENKEKIRTGKRNYYTRHPEKSKEQVKKYIENNLEKVKERRHKYYLKNLEKIKKIGAERYIKNKEQIKQNTKQWAKENIEKTRIYSKNKNIRYRKNPMKKLNMNISYGIWLSLNGNKKHRHWEDLVGYDITQLKKSLERKFQLGMSWENYGQWHIDHKIPKSAFNFSCPEDIDFKHCWSLENLQPLWGIENISKGAKLPHPFQPSLALNI